MRPVLRIHDRQLRFVHVAELFPLCVDRENPDFPCFLAGLQHLPVTFIEEASDLFRHQVAVDSAKDLVGRITEEIRASLINDPVFHRISVFDIHHNGEQVDDRIQKVPALQQLLLFQLQIGDIHHEA
ncbi:hypothetical protein D3C71_1741850 [compost metagenome]